MENVYLEYRQIVDRLVAANFRDDGEKFLPSHADAGMRRAFVLALMDEINSPVVPGSSME